MPRPTAVLHIPQPCPESWAAMTPANGGRHCAACQKKVVDFTQKTDAEILAYFRQVGKGKTCGRFRVGQLGRPLREARALRQPTRWQGWLAGLLVAALAAQSCRPTTMGEPQPRTLAPASTIRADDDSAEAGMPATQVLTLEGGVYSATTHQPVPDVTVKLPNTTATALTDAKGLFVMQLPDTLAIPERFYLQLLAEAYPTQTVLADTIVAPGQRLYVKLTSFPLPEHMLGDVEELRDKTE